MFSTLSFSCRCFQKHDLHYPICDMNRLAIPFCDSVSVYDPFHVVASKYV